MDVGAQNTIRDAIIAAYDQQTTDQDHDSHQDQDATPPAVAQSTETLDIKF